MSSEKELNSMVEEFGVEHSSNDTMESVALLHHVFDKLHELPKPVPFKSSLAVCSEANALKKHMGSPDEPAEEEAVELVSSLLDWYNSAFNDLDQEPDDASDITTARRAGAISDDSIEVDDGTEAVQIRALFTLNESLNMQTRPFLNVFFYYLSTGEVYAKATLRNDNNQPLMEATPLDVFLRERIGGLFEELRTAAQRIDYAVDIQENTHLSFTEAVVAIYTVLEDGRSSAIDRKISRHIRTESEIVYNYRRKALNREDDALEELERSRSTLEFLSNVRDELQ